MRRREVIGLLGGAAAAWPVAARAQQSAMPVIGFLRSGTLADVPHLVDAFRQGLKDAGFLEGKNVAIELRSAENRPDRLRAMVAELTRQHVALIVGNQPAAIAAKAATTNTPILFASGFDPVRDGLVASLNRPGGNVTGVVFFSTTLGGKRLQLLRQLVPNATTIAFLATPYTEAEGRDLQVAAQAVGQRLLVVDANSERDIESAFTTFARHRVGALLVSSGPFTISNRDRLIELAASHRLPAIYGLREFVSGGGLISYSSSIADAYRQVGIYAGRILKGEKPADLPVMQATKLQLVINLKTAKAIGLDIPPTLLALADEVIE
jgi:putative ABC transport system substrate-binding protein